MDSLAKRLETYLAQPATTDEIVWWDRAQPVVEYLEKVSKKGAEPMAERLSRLLDRVPTGKRTKSAFKFAILAIMLSTTRKPGSAPLVDWALQNLPLLTGSHELRAKRNIAWVAIYHWAYGGNTQFDCERKLGDGDLYFVLGEILVALEA